MDALCDDNILSMPDDLEIAIDDKWMDMQYLNEILFHSNGESSMDGSSNAAVAATVTDQQSNMFNFDYVDEMKFDPDDFFTDFSIKKEQLTDSESSGGFSSHRNTPSPSESSNSDEIFNKKSIKRELNGNVKLSLDTPPYSPPTTISTPPQSPESYCVNSSPPQVQSQSNRDSNCFKLIQIGSATGTLIPIQNVHITTSQNYQNSKQLKKIKIQPKPINNNVNQVNNSNSFAENGNSLSNKTILLSQNDFDALMTNVKLEKAGLIKKRPMKIITKKVPVVPKAEPFVLPKPIGSSLVNIGPIVNPAATPTPTVPQFVATPYLNKVDDRVLKKQQRMIKNRESACLSRKKKKEYVVTLEHHIEKLNMENQNLKKENVQLKDRLAKFQSFCKCSALSKVSVSPSMRKNVAVLCAMLFVVSLNFGPLNSMLNGREEYADIGQTNTGFSARHLLSVDDVSPNDTASSAIESYAEQLRLNVKNKNFTIPYPMCEKMYLNQSENIRLVHDLQKWIEISEYKNLSSIKAENKLSDKSFENFLQHNEALSAIYKQKQKSLWKDKKKVVSRKLKNKMKSVELYKERNSIQVYNSDSLKYSEFFDEIRRRSDTFYVVSFSGDHLLLPALAHNKTFRPKMSLMLPALGFNDSNSEDYITLMQIDCEVVNTSLLRIREKTIPDNLKTDYKFRGKDDLRKSSATANSPATNGTSDASAANLTNEFKPISLDKYKPYFINKAYRKTPLVNVDDGLKMMP